MRKRLTDEERKAKNRSYSNKYLAAHRDEINEKKRRYYAEHREEVAAYKREYRRKHIDHIKEVESAYRKRNAKKEKERNKRYREANKEILKEKCRKWREANPDKVKARSRAYQAAHREERNAYNRERRKKNPERFKASSRRNYVKHHAARLEYARKYREAHREELREKQRQIRIRVNRSPELYAIAADKRRVKYQANKDRYKESGRKYRAAHKRRIKRNARWYADRIRCQCRTDPEFYAMKRAKDRNAYIRKRERKGLSKPYKPHLSMRIPDTCCYDKVLDARSVFLWNNVSAASLRAGEAYKRMMWREAHCDRFGEVCR